MSLGKYLKKKVRKRYGLYKQERGIKQREAKQLRAEVLKARLETKRKHAIMFAKERERIGYQKKIKLLKRPPTRGFAPLFSRKAIMIKPKKRKKKRKKKR